MPVTGPSSSPLPPQQPAATDSAGDAAAQPTFYGETQLYFTGSSNAQGQPILKDAQTGHSFYLEKDGNTEHLKDLQTGLYVQQDAKGNPLYDAKGNPQLLNLGPLLAVKLSLENNLQAWYQSFFHKASDPSSIQTAQDKTSLEVELKAQKEKNRDKEQSLLDRIQAEQKELQEHLKNPPVNPHE